MFFDYFVALYTLLNPGNFMRYRGKKLHKQNPFVQHSTGFSWSLLQYVQCKTRQEQDHDPKIAFPKFSNTMDGYADLSEKYFATLIGKLQPALGSEKCTFYDHELLSAHVCTEICAFLKQFCTNDCKVIANPCQDHMR